MTTDCAACAIMDAACERNESESTAESDPIATTMDSAEFNYPPRRHLTYVHTIAIAATVAGGRGGSSDDGFSRSMSIDLWFAIRLYGRRPSSSSQILLPPPVVITQSESHPCMRGYSSVHTQQPAGPIREYNIDPYILLDEELKYIFEDIRQEINRATNHQELKKIAVYYFDGQGKAIRPMVAMLMAKALNYHMHNETSNVVHAQRQIAMISEMIHTASLVHDDVIDQSFARRGKPSVNVIWNHKKPAVGPPATTPRSCQEKSIITTAAAAPPFPA
ncbi:hypothetical protein RP20_CCG016020 [Aedes albopictus]|nr:hypothetical protein RP20_CCG016020 [Aedes albopictus]